MIIINPNLETDCVCNTVKHPMVKHIQVDCLYLNFNGTHCVTVTMSGPLPFKSPKKNY